jgi:hypothetical protein
MSNCYVMLGDHVWQQSTGIPMGFSCSSIWCNMYLLSYKIKFIQRLARLGRKDLLLKFQTPFWYIDDLCLINVQNPRCFLSPDQPRHEENPFWIYPLHILEIKEETSQFSSLDPQKGVVAHFMNVEVAVNERHPELYTFQKFDKRRALPFQYTQYIKFSSNRPVRQAYNICISKVLPILYISNIDATALCEIRCLIQTMCDNGFKRTRFIRTICQFLETGPFPAVKAHTEHICYDLSLDLEAQTTHYQV